jgi:hypothetical protein
MYLKQVRACRIVSACARVCCGDGLCWHLLRAGVGEAVSHCFVGYRPKQ